MRTEGMSSSPPSTTQAMAADRYLGAGRQILQVYITGRRPVPLTSEKAKYCVHNCELTVVIFSTSAFRLNALYVLPQVSPLDGAIGIASSLARTSGLFCPSVYIFPLDYSRQERPCVGEVGKLSFWDVEPLPLSAGKLFCRDKSAGWRSLGGLVAWWLAVRLARISASRLHLSLGFHSAGKYAEMD